MKITKNLLLGCAAVIVTTAAAQAADLPTRKAAPVQYVKICDAYGAGFFYIPGTDTCLHIGGLVLAQWTVWNTPYRINNQNFVAPTSLAAVSTGGGITPGVAYLPSTSRDAVASAAVGRLELDARSQSPWGTVRSFLRINSTFGSGNASNTGDLTNAVLGLNGFSGTYAARETTFLEKGFIQFAGITMGRIQSMFDFYADALGYTALRGSNQTVNAIAYTFTAGGGFSATIAVEDSVSHRSTIGNEVTFNAAGVGAFSGTPSANLNGTRIPDIVGNLRLDQPWGSAQISGAAHQIRASLYSNAITINQAGQTPLPVGTPFNSVNGFGFAVQGGLMFKLDMLAPGDQLWLQATYAKGAIGYVTGSNFGFTGGVDAQPFYGIGIARMPGGSYWNGTGDTDCVFTPTGSCDKSTGFAIVGGLKHYWTPTVSTSLTASYYGALYSNTVNNPTMAAAALNIGTIPFIPGQTNYREVRIAGNLVWNPVSNFEIGAGLEYDHGITSRPVGLAPDAVLVASGFPAWKGQADLLVGRVRMSRGF